MRKYPPATSVQRIASQDYHIPDTKIVLEKGTAVLVPIYAIHHDPEIYPIPEKFDPDRFSPEEVKKRHQFSWLPFGGGGRICIGMRFESEILREIVHKRRTKLFLRCFDFFI